MLDSLYHTPDITTAKAIDYLKASSVKFYVNNYRVVALPTDIKNYLNENYQHFWGSIYLYAPLIKKGAHHMNIKFSGKYKINSHSAIEIDHVKITPLSTITLTKGEHTSNAPTNYRLYFQEETVIPLLNPFYKADKWRSVI